ncbi:fructose-1,6-bisphosphatase/inositol monophosphatase family enzyme [Nocardioides luteus]|uniref:Fructose-1,6-bisphosphatase n=1 Tax=Nocardioides luteus TaxID=1844 RepID=A0ABQ5SYQ1_9ACTN|nr:inositol monophosphatase [Nocardioides luteus]MDR7310908.1 fructose-1,6-bisphosphatase/inositol monophosphatase family enzyme [Nocardioides luteus]GGR39832.1 fructose-1,6-bisphosphatase [Nocardioides luteus]GLJ69312.1 fructose-1,6-bisphosphatase [Nocardioides luteus]
MTAPTEADVRLATELVRGAGSLAAKMRHEGIDASVETKTSVSDLVTAADKAAEKAIVDRLATERPDDGILGEEGSARDSASGRVWTIDPVDGTYNFVRGLDWWCSALALTDGDDILLGAVYSPAEDAVYVGGPDLPTTRNGVRLDAIPDTPLDLACLTTYLHPARLKQPVGEAYIRVTGGAASIRILGSGSMDLTAIAQGKLHLFCQHSVPDWDRLPGWALVLGAGGATTQVEAGGALWSLAGAPTAVADAARALTSE